MSDLRVHVIEEIIKYGFLEVTLTDEVINEIGCASPCDSITFEVDGVTEYEGTAGETRLALTLKPGSIESDCGDDDGMEETDL